MVKDIVAEEVEKNDLSNLDFFVAALEVFTNVKCIDAFDVIFTCYKKNICEEITFASCNALYELSPLYNEKILNLVNGAETQCVLSALPSPMEEQFVYRNKSLVNASIWLGFGNLLDELKQEKTKVQKLKEFIMRQILKKEMAKKGENA